MPEDIGFDEDLPVERKAAELSLRKAREAASRGRVEEAVQHATDALENDPAYLEVRRFLGELYEGADENARASREYQAIIQSDRDDESAWEALRRVDPTGAERLERLHDIAPDPFVGTRQPVNSNMLSDIGANDEENEEEYDEDESQSETVSTAEPPAVQQTSPDGEIDARVAWAFEQDYEFRHHLLARPGISDMVEKLQDMSMDYDAWERALVSCAHLDKERWAQEYEVTAEIVEFFGIEHPSLYFAPERRMIPTIIGGDPTMVAITAGMINALPDATLHFVLGRTMAHLALHDQLCRQVATVCLQRSPASQTDVEEALTDLLVTTTLGWDVGVSRDEMIMTRKVAHAWDQRAALSADRGGLLACGDIDAACLAIARGTARDSDIAATLSLAEFMAQYDGKDPRQLAAIDPKECPLRNGPYGAYRILMLKWWARSDQYQQLAGA